MEIHGRPSLLSSVFAINISITEPGETHLHTEHCETTHCLSESDRPSRARYAEGTDCERMEWLSSETAEVLAGSLDIPGVECKSH